MTAQLDLLDLLAETADEPPRPEPKRTPLRLTDDEKLVIWWQQTRLALPSLAVRTDWTIRTLRDSYSGGGDYRIGRSWDKTRITVTFHDRSPAYGGDCPPSCRQHGPDLGAYTHLCAPGARGHGNGFTDTGRTHTAELRWTRLAKWMTSLTDADRSEIAACGQHWLALPRLHWPLTRLLGPRPALDAVFQETQ
ncbi:hypothetical protein [Gordonia caeni]|uniref:Transposase n=1 Tax=Gordonia caeni TaxID=1007097 RepID=A0ABP7PCF9_9ACTN